MEKKNAEHFRLESCYHLRKKQTMSPLVASFALMFVIALAGFIQHNNFYSSTLTVHIKVHRSVACTVKGFAAIDELNCSFQIDSSIY